MANYVVWIMGQSNAGKFSNVFSGAYDEPYVSGDLTCKHRYITDDAIYDADFQQTGNRLIGVEVGMAYWFNQNYPNDQLYILQYGYGSAAITENALKPKTWYKGSIYGTEIVYDDFVPAANDIINNELPADYIDLGVFWLQGESDGTSSNYVDSFYYLFDNLNNDVSGGFDKKIAISSLALLASGAQIDANFQTIIDSDTNKYSPLVQTSDLEYNQTNVHYTVDSYLTLGQRGIEALFNILTNNTSNDRLSISTQSNTLNVSIPSSNLNINK
jgi:hypothetical protein